MYDKFFVMISFERDERDRDTGLSKAYVQLRQVGVRQGRIQNDGLRLFFVR